MGDGDVEDSEKARDVGDRPTRARADPLLCSMSVREALFLSNLRGWRLGLGTGSRDVVLGATLPRARAARTMTALLVSALALAGAASVVADDSSSSSSSPALGLAGPSWSSSSSSSWRAVNLADPNAWLESLRARAETIAESRASVGDIYRPLFLASPEGGGEGEGGDRDRGRGRDLGRFDVGPAPGAAGGVAPLLDPDDPIIGRLTLDALELADEIAVTTAPDAALAAKDAAGVLAEQADLAFASLQDAKDDLSSSSSSASEFAAAHPYAATIARIAAGAETYPFASGAASADGVSGFSGRRCCGVRARDLRGWCLRRRLRRRGTRHPRRPRARSHRDDDREDTVHAGKGTRRHLLRAGGESGGRQPVARRASRHSSRGILRAAAAAAGGGAATAASPLARARHTRRNSGEGDAGLRRARRRRWKRERRGSGGECGLV